jgi:hypothetical protein
MQSLSIPDPPSPFAAAIAGCLKRAEPLLNLVLGIDLCDFVLSPRPLPKAVNKGLK